MNFGYYIAVNRDAFASYVKHNGLDFISSKFIYDHFQLAGLKDITIKVIGYGNKALETEVLLRYSHHNIKLEYI